MGGGSIPRAGCFTPGNDPVPVVQEAGWAPGPVWTSTEILLPLEFDPLTVQAVASRYTDCATLAILLYTVELHLSGTGYPDRLGPLGKFVENFRKLTCLEITGYRIKYRTVLWLLELQIRRGRKVKRMYTLSIVTAELHATNIAYFQ